MAVVTTVEAITVGGITAEAITVDAMAMVGAAPSPSGGRQNFPTEFSKRRGINPAPLFRSDE
jgi:hypothetical protein